MVDSTYKNTPFAAAANYELAELYRYNFLKYDSAQFFYARSVAGNPPKDYVEKARSNSLLFQKYGKLRKDINRFDRQLFYTQNPEIFVKDSAAYLEDSLKILNDFLAKKELEDIWKIADNSLTLPGADKNIDTAVVKHKIIIADSLKKVDSLIQIGLYDPPDSTGLRQKLQNYLINKFVSDSLSRLDSLVKIGRYNPQDTIGLRLKLTNTLGEKSKSSLSPKDDTQTKLAQLLKNPNQVRLDTVKFKKNPPLKLKISVDSAKTVLAKTSLELGNLFLAELNVPDSAYYIYNTILDKYPAPAYYPLTLYALGSYYLTVDNKPKADSLFRVIYDNYKDKSIVNAAASKLNLPLIDLTFDPAKDKYASAEDLMLTGDYHQSINRFYNIYKTYPKSPIAPQALYTTGWILENDLFMYDSAAVVYDTLVTKYPSSVYVKNVNKKLITYKQEKARIQKAYQDSLLALQKQQTDSLTAVANVEDQTQKILEDEVAMEKQEVNNPVNITTIPPKTNGLPQKKLEPLWDPRKHFQ
jgi:outer membrane protein assembly factor BamD (BamD/ComL family)